MNEGDLVRTVFVVLLLFCLDASAKVRLITFHFNKPNFLEWQIKSIQKYLLDDYELIVINDAIQPDLQAAIETTCATYAIPCVRFEQEWHKDDPLTQRVYDWLQGEAEGSYSSLYPKSSYSLVENFPSIRHAHLLRFAMEHFGYDHDDIVVILDGDLFFLRPTSIRAMMENYDLVGSDRSVPDSRYISVPFVAMDMRTLPNKRDFTFDLDLLHHQLGDTGSHIHYYLIDNPDVRLHIFPYYSKRIHNLPTQDLASYGFTPKQIDLMDSIFDTTNAEFHIDFHFFHYGASAYSHLGWKKSILTKQLLTSLLEDL